MKFITLSEITMVLDVKLLLNSIPAQKWLYMTDVTYCNATFLRIYCLAHTIWVLDYSYTYTKWKDHNLLLLLATIFDIHWRFSITMYWHVKNADKTTN